ncbi:MAG: type I restriction-modification system subunit M N-terminal domain-containing protein, partial [Treponema sp.]|nr:type I restriction-modification system subunit M N-terminal domain-containing protein [Treponema sp.]
MAKAKKEKIQKSEDSLTKKVWKMANVLSSAGVGFTDYITQLTYILFLKMDNEREELIGLPSSIPEGCRWSDLTTDKNGKKLIGDDLIKKYEKILDTLKDKEGLIGAIFTKASNK